VAGCATGRKEAARQAGLNHLAKSIRAPGAGPRGRAGPACDTGNMQGYGQYCPLARGAEVLGDRWTLLIIREMLFGVQRFNELERFLPGISRSVLAQRLRHLQRVGLVERATPTASGRCTS
jgi:HxlR-like helix-turn-helix